MNRTDKQALLTKVFSGDTQALRQMRPAQYTPTAEEFAANPDPAYWEAYNDVLAMPPEQMKNLVAYYARLDAKQEGSDWPLDSIPQ